MAAASVLDSLLRSLISAPSFLAGWLLALALALALELAPALALALELAPALALASGWGGGWFRSA